MAEKMLTNWFTFLLYKFLKVGGRGGPGGGARHRPQLGGREWPRPWRDAPGTCVCPLASPEAVQFSLSCQGKVEVSLMGVDGRTQLSRVEVQALWGSCGPCGPDRGSDGAPGQGVCVQP